MKTLQRLTFSLVCGFALLGVCLAGSTSIDLYADAYGGHAPDTVASAWVHLGDLDDATMIRGDHVYTFPVGPGVSLDPNTVYWVVLTTINGAGVQWDHEAGNAGLAVSGNGYWSTGSGYQDNSTGALLMTFVDSAGAEFDSLGAAHGGGTIAGRYPMSGVKLGASMTTGPAPGTLTSVSLELYSPGPPSTTVAVYADNGSGTAPGNWIANLGAVLDTSLIPGDNVYTFPATGVTLSGNTLYWIVVSSATGSMAQWDYETSNAGLNVAGHGYYSAQFGYAGNSMGAYIMSVNSGEGDEFDSLSKQYGGGTVFSSDGVTYGPLGASWRTGAAPIRLASVSVLLYDPSQTPPTTPLPSTALLLGAGLAGFAVWLWRAKAARRAIALALPLAAALALSVPAQAQPVSSVKHSVARDEVNETLTYWTPERMASAIPMPMPTATEEVAEPRVPRRLRSGAMRRPQGTTVLTPGFDPAGLPDDLTRDGTFEPHEPVYPAPTGDCVDCTGNHCNPYQSTFYVPPTYYDTANSNLPYRAIGKIYFTMDGRNYVCSGASIGGSAVLTAGHCVSDGRGNFDTHWIFVPAFDDYISPFAGPWMASELLTFDAWLNGLDLSRDVGFAIVAGPSTQTLSEVIGHLGFAWNQDPTGLDWNAFGYPMLTFNGIEMVQTNATTACRNSGLAPATVGIGSRVKSGGSGGPWLLDFRGTLTDTNWNYVGGVFSTIDSTGDQAFSPYFDQAVKDLKDEAVAEEP